MRIFIENGVAATGVDPVFRTSGIPSAIASTIKGAFGHALAQYFRFEDFTISYAILQMEQPGMVYIYTDQDELTFLFCLKGHTGVMPGTADVRCLREGQYSILASKEVWHYCRLEAGEHHLLQLNIRKEYLETLRYSYPLINQMLTASGFNVIAMPLKALLRVHTIIHCRIRGAAGRCMIEASAKQLLIYVLSELSERKVNGYVLTFMERQTLEAVRSYILNNLGRKITIPLLGRQFGLASTNLKQHFKIMYHTTIRSFLIESRMELAKLLLEEGEKISQVSEKVGYAETSNFIRVFKSHTGITPAAYRTNITRPI